MPRAGAVPVLGIFFRMGQRAALMERMGASSAEVIAWLEEYRDRTCAYRPLLELYRKHDLPRAIEWVQQHRDQCENTWDMAADTKKLMELLEQAGRQQVADDELRHLVLDLKCLEPSYLVKLKQITPSDAWKRMFSLLLMETRTPDARMRLYRFAGMYDRLCEELCRKPSLDSFLQYEKKLREWNPERTKHLYVELLKQLMDRAGQRSHYRELIGHLQTLRSYPEGQSAAQSLASYWYVYHKNRPAMKDELCQAGYLP